MTPSSCPCHGASRGQQTAWQQQHQHYPWPNAPTCPCPAPEQKQLSPEEEEESRCASPTRLVFDSCPAASRRAVSPLPDGFIFPLQPPTPHSLPGGREVRAVPASTMTATLPLHQRYKLLEQSHGNFF